MARKAKDDMGSYYMSRNGACSASYDVLVDCNNLYLLLISYYPWQYEQDIREKGKTTRRLF